MISQHKDSSSDNMIDIQIEESLGRETLMTIDSSNFHEDLFSILGFIIILVITTITGIVGPKPYDFQAQNVLIENGKLEFVLTHNQISVFNRYSTFYLEFEKLKKTESFDPIISKIVIKFTFLNGRDIVSSFEKVYNDQRILFNPNQVNSIPMKIYDNKLIRYDLVRLEIEITGAKDFKSAQISHHFGTVQHSYFEIYFRTTFAAIEMLFLVFFIFSLRTVSHSYWHLEQKLTAPLLFLSILNNNPLVYLSVAFPSQVGLFLEILIKCIFSTYFRFFILVLFDSLRYKNRKTDKCFFAPKILFSTVMFAVMFIYSIFTELSMFLPSITQGQSDLIGYANIALFGLYLVWATTSTLFAGCQVDITERYKYIIYIISGLSALALLAVSEVLFKVFKYFQDSALQFVEQHSVYNVFSMLMAYFHWPFEILRDQDYIDGDLQADLPPQFFVNEDEE